MAGFLNSNKKLFYLYMVAMLIDTCCCQNASNVQTTLSVPIGAILPEGDSVAKSVFKMVLRNHNTRVATLTSSADEDRQPFLQFRIFLQTSKINDSFVMVREVCNHVSHRAHSIIGFWNKVTSSSVLGHASAFRIPWITPSFLASPVKSEFLVALHPRIGKIFPLFIQRMKWKKFTYLFDAEGIYLSGLDLYEFSMKNSLKVMLRNLGRSQNILPVLKKIFYNDEFNVIIDVSLERSLSIINQIKALDMTTSEFHYVFTDLNLVDQDWKDFGEVFCNLTFFSFIDKTADEYTRFRETVQSASMNVPKKFTVNNKKGKKLLTCFETPERFSLFVNLMTASALLYDAFTSMAVGMNRLQGEAFQYGVEKETGRQDQATCNSIPVLPLENGFEISRAIKKVKFKGLTGNVEFNKGGERINFVTNIYSLKTTGMVNLGQYTDSTEGGILALNGTVNGEASTFANKTVVITTILEEPYMMLKENWESLLNNDRYEGFCADILQAMVKIFPFQYRIKVVADGNYGSKNDIDGKWNGMIGEVKYQKADMAVAPLTITSAREAVVEFTKPFMSLGISIMIKKPEKQTPSIFSFLEPLSYEIWICILFAYVGVSVVLYFVSKFSPYEHHKGSISGKASDDGEVDFTILNSLWFSIGSFVQQGCDVSPKSISGRLVGGVWWFFTLIIISSYTANLAAFLTVDRMESPISGAEDLVKQSTIKYGTLKSGSTANFFKQSPLSTYEKMWSYMSTQGPSVFVNSNKEGIERVRSSQGKYAFLMESSLNEYMEQRKPCNTMKVGPNLDAKGYGIAVRKGSPLYENVNLAILKLREQGTLQKMKNYWWFEKSECGPSHSSGPTRTPALALSNVAGVFYILIGGITIAVPLAVLEFTYQSIILRRKAKKLKKTNSKCLLPAKEEDQREVAKKMALFQLPRGGGKDLPGNI